MQKSAGWGFALSTGNGLDHGKFLLLRKLFVKASHLLFAITVLNELVMRNVYNSIAQTQPKQLIGYWLTLTNSSSGLGVLEVENSDER